MRQRLAPSSPSHGDSAFEPPLGKKTPRSPGGMLESTGHDFSRVPIHAEAGTGSSPAGPALSRSPAPGTPPQPAQAGPWSPSFLTITLSSHRNDCFGIAMPGVLDPYSNCGSPVKPPFCQSARVPFEVDFLIDRADHPRPQPVTPPSVSVLFEFTPTGGRTTQNFHFTDPAPRYVSPNLPLEPSFGRQFPIGSTESGRLMVLLQLHDPSGTDVIYRDNIEYVIVPCM